VCAVDSFLVVVAPILLCSFVVWLQVHVLVNLSSVVEKSGRAWGQTHDLGGRSPV
jgi:hypothetical protein